MKNKTRRILIFIIVLTGFLLWRSGFIGLAAEGMASVANDTKQFTDRTGHLVNGAYSVSIDLSNLESNIGKELYNDGQHKITVDWVDNTGHANTGGFRIGFRSSGTYSLNGASLVSGIWHQTLGEQQFTYNMSAQMTAHYQNKTYTSPVFGVSGLNYRDGDDFAFYLFPGEAYDNGDISLDETGVVEVTITNLYYNSWRR